MERLAFSRINFFLALIDSLYKEGIHFVKAPESLKAIFVVFSLTVETSIKHFGIFLPGLQAEHVESYLKFEIDSYSEFSLVQPSEVDFLKMSSGYLEIWPRI